jgi:hypothetical protein
MSGTHAAAGSQAADALYQERADGFNRECAALEARRRRALIGLVVLLVVALAALRVAVSLESSALAIAGPLLLLPAVGCGLIWWLLGGRLHRAAGLAEVNEEARGRLSLAWDDLPLRHTIRAGAEHPFATDLDLFGRASIFHRIEGCTTPVGEAVLAGWLMEGADAGAIGVRQQAVTELAPMVDLRQAIALHARDVGADGPDPAPFLLWAEESRPLLHPALIWAARGSPIAGWSFLVAQLAGLVSAPIWIGFVLVNLVILQLAGGRAVGAPQALWEQQRTLRPYARILDLLTHPTFQSTALRRIQGMIDDGRTNAARELGRLRLAARLSFPMSSEFYWAAQALFLLDVNVVGVADRWRSRNGRRVRGWIEAMGEAEALAALAVLAHDHPDWTMPAIDARTTTVQAAGLGHPLIPAAVRVVNDVEIGPPGTFLFVTGSNMSGKSTLLRTVGVNLMLAYAGAPVCATALRAPPARLWTAMRVQDSLARGESYFFAEVLRLKALVDAARCTTAGTDRRFVYLIDEIFQGTNSVERRIAGRRILRELLRLGAIGAVSTHDLSLAEGGSLAHAARSVHFTETVVESGGGPAMTFDYRLRPGIATSTNALRVLEMVGLDLGDDPDD